MVQDDFKAWIGRSVTRRDLVTERLVAQFRATLTPHLFEVECPPGLYSCLAVPAHPPENLGPDGAEKKGLFLPPIELPLRRWWGSELQILGDFRIGDEVERISRVVDVVTTSRREKIFVSVRIEHVLEVQGNVVVRELQKLIFLDTGHDGKVPDCVTSEQIASHDRHWRVRVDESMLMRFSAVTFNSHRIHYDKDFATAEGHTGLLVHGPLQAALLLNQLALLKGAVPQQFSYDCVSPLTAPQTAQILSRLYGSSGQGTVLTEDGFVTTRGTASWN
jgi:3-methylfumaryl-CoA hydratase